MENNVNKKMEKRVQYLALLYEKADGHELKLFDKDELGKELGLDTEETLSIVLYLKGRGLIYWMAENEVGVTQLGIDAIEKPMLPNKGEKRRFWIEKLWIPIILLIIGAFIGVYIQNHFGTEKIQQSIKDNPTVVLLPNEEKLLSTLYKYQKQFALDYLMIGKDGTLFLKNNNSRINIIEETYAIDSPDSNHIEKFESLMDNIDQDYLKKPNSEAGMDVAYKVQVTQKGIEYLQRENKS